MEDQKSMNQIHEEEMVSGVDGAYPDKSPNAVTLYRTYSPSQAAAIERRLVRKLDTRILPVIVLIYILNYVRI